YLLIVGDGINELDASGEEVVRHLVQRLRAGGTTVLFSGLKKQVIDVMRATGLFYYVGQPSIFATADQAIAAASAAEEINVTVVALMMRAHRAIQTAATSHAIVERAS
ncbi:MAG: STAS domain-containing protein, partial [Polaromonas sp.]|nr:STAS domain-containing protein [Polaromonas sp.]